MTSDVGRSVADLATILVLDIGTSGIRAVVFDQRGAAVANEHREVLPDSPAPGLVSFDAPRQAAVALELARRAIERVGPVAAIGVTNQRASTIGWDRETGVPIGPGLGWQDQRSVEGAGLLGAAGFVASTGSLGPIAHWLHATLDADLDRVVFGTVDTWIVWALTGGEAFVTDATNASGSMLWSPDHDDWHPDMLAALGLPRRAFATVRPTVGDFGRATALPGSPPIVAVAGDQMAALAAHGPLDRGRTKMTFGTGGMLDVVVGARPVGGFSATHGCVPMMACRTAERDDWMLEGVMMACGTNVEWLRDGLGLIDSVGASDALAASCDHADGVVYVPALLGLGTPSWDFSARGTLFGLSRSTRPAHIARAVLEGVAHLTTDLVDAAERAVGLPIDRLSVDGGMTANATFVQAVADATGRPIDVACDTEMTARGAALLAGTALGWWSGHDDVASAWAPSRTAEPGRALDRGAWHEACRRATALQRPL